MKLDPSPCTIDQNDADDLPVPRGRISCPFPWRLHDMLSAVEKEGLERIVSWRPHGRAFLVHDPKSFASQIMPRFFDQTKYQSFQRQLNLYGFGRFTQGPDKNAYFHLSFVRGRRSLARQITRCKVKGTKVRNALAVADGPNFYDGSWDQPRQNVVSASIPTHTCLNNDQCVSGDDQGGNCSISPVAIVVPSAPLEVKNALGPDSVQPTHLPVVSPHTHGRGLVSVSDPNVESNMQHFNSSRAFSATSFAKYNGLSMFGTGWLSRSDQLGLRKDVSDWSTNGNARYSPSPVPLQMQSPTLGHDSIRGGYTDILSVMKTSSRDENVGEFDYNDNFSPFSDVSLRGCSGKSVHEDDDIAFFEGKAFHFVDQDVF